MYVYIFIYIYKAALEAPEGGAAPRRGDSILLEKNFYLKLSGNEVCCTNALLLMIKFMMYGNIHCQKVLIRKFFHARFPPALHLGDKGLGVDGAALLPRRLDLPLLFITPPPIEVRTPMARGRSTYSSR